METEVIKLNVDDQDSASKIKQAAAIVDNGGLVAFPTETVYGIACRVHSDTLARLGEIKARNDDKPYTLHIGEKQQINRYVPTVDPRLQKLIEKAWPGPVTIVFDVQDSDIGRLRETLDEDIIESLYAGGSVGVRCPDNAVAGRLLHLARRAVVAPSANKSGGEPAVEAGQVMAEFSGQIEMLLDGGPCRYGKSSTVVKMGKKGLKILRQGVYSEEKLAELSKVQILFVCTGNTCRSAMAEGICRKYLAEKLRCEVDEVESLGYKVVSAGMMDLLGSPASPEALVACAAKGIDIKGHQSRPLSQELIEQSDYIFAMERMHEEKVIALCPEASERCRLLAGEDEIPDPIGQPQMIFDNCAGWIERFVGERISELVK